MDCSLPGSSIHGIFQARVLEWGCHCLKFLKKLKIELPYDSSNPTLGHIPGKKIIIQNDTCFSIFIAVVFTVAKTRKQPKYPLTDEWIKMCYINTMEYYSVIKRNETMQFAVTLMDLETAIQSEESQKEKNKRRIMSLICGI